MRGLIFGAALAIGTLAAGSVSAASLGLVTGTPSFSSSVGDSIYVDFGFGFGSLIGYFYALDANGVATTGPADTFFFAEFGLADPTDTSDFAFGGFLDIANLDGQILVGDLAAIGFTDNTIELQYDNLGGPGAGLFGTSILALLTFDDNLGPNPFDSFADREFYTGSITISNVLTATPVPLPAALPLMLTGLGGIAWLGRRKRHS